MESNSNDNYVLVLEDRTEVKNEQEAGKLSVVSGIDDKGNLKTTEATAANQAAFLKFNNKDGLLKNFMTNFLKQFNNPTHFGLYKVVADNVEQGVDNLRTMLQSHEKPESKQQLAEMGIPFGDYGRRAISLQLLFLSATPPSTLKHALRSVRTITAISVWLFIL